MSSHVADAGASKHELEAPLPTPPDLSDGCALFLDVDGCLLEFDENPLRVRAEPALVRCLEALHRRLGGALALVSGRSIAMLDAMFAPARFPCAGLHGLERRNAMLEMEDAQPSPFAGTHWNGIVADAHTWLAAHPKARIEDKGRTLALHWRAAPGAEARAHAFAAHALERLPGYELQPGDHVLELRPAGADKGTAIAAFLAEPPFARRRPVFAGDDLTDEHGFEVVNERGGISIVIGDRRPTRANHRLADPAAVRRWLEAAG